MVIGTPSTAADPFDRAITFAGNWLVDTFNNPISYVGHTGNFQAYVNTITLEPGVTGSLLHFIVLGQRVNASSSAGVQAAVEGTATGLAVRAGNRRPERWRRFAQSTTSTSLR